MAPDPLTTYRRAQDVFDTAVAAVPAIGWDAPSACAAWTVRDVVGHIVWGQEQLRAWATGQENPSNHPATAPSGVSGKPLTRPFRNMDGAPGAPHPGTMAGADPVATWRRARAATAAALTDEALAGTATLPALGEIPLTAVLTLLVSDHLAHAWDVALPLGIDLRIDADLIAGSLAWAHDNVIRAPGFFGPERTPPPDADEQERWLAYLGRATRQREGVT